MSLELTAHEEAERNARLVTDKRKRAESAPKKPIAIREATLQ